MTDEGFLQLSPLPLTNGSCYMLSLTTLYLTLSIVRCYREGDMAYISSCFGAVLVPSCAFSSQSLVGFSNRFACVWNHLLPRLIHLLVNLKISLSRGFLLVRFVGFCSGASICCSLL
jgi:hypothetical protein